MTEQTTVARTARRGAVAVLLFWLVLFGALYAGFDRYQQRQQAQYQAYTSSTGALVIPRGRDGHFWVRGEINGQPLRFMVDTGASHVGVTEGFARKAGLAGGAPTRFLTANGEREGRLLREVPVLAGGLAARASVGIGQSGSDAQGLLGQSFLAQFDMQVGEKEMVLHPR